MRTFTASLEIRNRTMTTATLVTPSTTRSRSASKYHRNGTIMAVQTVPSAIPANPAKTSRTTASNTTSGVERKYVQVCARPDPIMSASENTNATIAIVISRSQSETATERNPDNLPEGLAAGRERTLPLEVFKDVTLPANIRREAAIRVTKLTTFDSE